MRRIKCFAGLPDGKYQVQQLAHGVPDGDRLLVGMLGDQALIERAHRRVAADGGQGGHPQGAAHQVVAAGAHHGAARAAGLAVALDAAADLDGEDAEVSDQLVGRGEALAVENKGGQHRGRDVADAVDAVEVIRSG